MNHEIRWNQRVSTASQVAPCTWVMAVLHDGTAGLAVRSLEAVLLEPTAERDFSQPTLRYGLVTSAVMAWSCLRLSFSPGPVICGHLRSYAYPHCQGRCSPVPFRPLWAMLICC